jgi:hypothetical protein
MITYWYLQALVVLRLHHWWFWGWHLQAWLDPWALSPCCCCDKVFLLFFILLFPLCNLQIMHCFDPLFIWTFRMTCIRRSWSLVPCKVRGYFLHC